MNTRSRYRWIPLLALSSVAALGACGGKVFVDADAAPDPADAGDVNACVAACAAQLPHGYEVFQISGVGCLCDGCSAECAQQVCTDQQLPSDACLPCVKAAYLGDECQNHDGLFSQCTNGGTHECQIFADCLVACPDQS